MSFHYYSTFDPYQMSERESEYSSDSDSTTSDSILVLSEYSDYSSDTDTIEDRIFITDEYFVDEPKLDGHYYVGKARHSLHDGYLLDIAISPRTFFLFNYNHVVDYLNLYSVFYPSHNTNIVHIMKLHIVKSKYHVILKTHWVRLVQRHWKKVFRERCLMMARRYSLANLRHRELTGRHLPGCNHFPHLAGMMSVYQCKVSK
jgi:hypothetical protein